MGEMTDQLAFVTMNGQPLAFSHAVLIQATDGWHVALFELPPSSCPFLRDECEIVLTTTAGVRLTGRATPELIVAGYVLMSGAGRLSLITSTDAA
jgi:hypothetical protein